MQLVAYVQYRRKGIWIPWYVERAVIIKPMCIQIIPKYRDKLQWQSTILHLHRDQHQICLRSVRVRIRRQADYYEAVRQLKGHAWVNVL